MYNVIKIKERLNKLKPGENKSPVCNDPVAVCRYKNNTSENIRKIDIDKIDIGEDE